MQKCFYKQNMLQRIRSYNNNKNTTTINEFHEGLVVNKEKSIDGTLLSTEHYYNVLFFKSESIFPEICATICRLGAAGQHFNPVGPPILLEMVSMVSLQTFFST